MSLYITGLNLPESHEIVGFYIDGETRNVMNLDRTKLLGHVTEVPVPHGRLIDASNIVTVSHCDSFSNWYEDRLSIDDLLLKTHARPYVPTVIKPEDTYIFPYALNQEAEVFVDGKWVHGKIVDGYRFRDGIVTVEINNGKLFWCPVDRTDLYREVKGDTE